MRASHRFFLVLFALSTLLPAQRRRRNDAPAEMQHFVFEEDRFESEAVGQRMPYGVYLPKGYDDEANAKKRWPLVIWLHGMWEDHMRFHTRGGAKLLDKSVADGTLPPCVFVTANGGRSSMYMNRGKERWQDLISKDLLDHVGKTYRVAEPVGTPLQPLWQVPARLRTSRAAKKFVDYQNDTTAADLQLAVREGYRSIEHVKRYTAMGFGTDQGKLGNINS